LNAPARGSCLSAWLGCDEQHAQTLRANDILLIPMFTYAMQILRVWSANRVRPRGRA
jgi:hypothetical protein